MTWNAAMHVAGCACLTSMFVISIVSMVEVVAPQWRRILSLAAGNFTPPAEPTAVDASREQRA